MEWNLVIDCSVDGIAVAVTVMIMGVTIMVSPKRLQEIMQRCKA
jgi:hypothetical protein